MEEDVTGFPSNIIMRKEQEITEIIKYTQLQKHSAKTSFKKMDSGKNTKRKKFN